MRLGSHTSLRQDCASAAYFSYQCAGLDVEEGIGGGLQLVEDEPARGSCDAIASMPQPGHETGLWSPTGSPCARRWRSGPAAGSRGTSGVLRVAHRPSFFQRPRSVQPY